MHCVWGGNGVSEGKLRLSGMVSIDQTHMRRKRGLTPRRIGDMCTNLLADWTTPPRNCPFNHW
ncbi:hypothetical protein DPMN_079846 [Dreissena polymorpha]|uniref:Uncharacterized protein n=1 Tax=Dreissena polymorpha TaxID=45954 RepID=A0A9D3YTB7_DREPO|nr:hypothetical protein DPMN_079846 [Dreissena polymorpha]